MPKSQAEALAKEQVKLLQQQMDQLATKSDLQLLKADLRSSEDRINAKLDNLENKIAANEKQVDVRFESLENKIAANEKRADERFKTSDEKLKAEIAKLQSHLILMFGSGLGAAVGIILGALQLMR